MENSQQCDIQMEQAPVAGTSAAIVIYQIVNQNSSPAAPSSFPCICNGEKAVDLNMVKCGNASCYGKTFHLSCINKKRVGKNWKCDVCVKKSRPNRKALAVIN
jgi:hypothetical protein